MEKGNIYLLLNGECCSGKTVAWSCAVGQMMEGVENFHLEYEEAAEGEPLIKMYSDLKHGKLPGRGPDRPELYTFQLKRRDENICRIIGMDYFSCHMDDADAYREETTIYDNMLKRATMLIFIIPGEIIDKYISVNDENAMEGMKKEIRRAEVTYFANTIKISLLRTKKLRKDCPPALFYITKSDVAKCTDKEKMDVLKKFIKDYSFFDFAEKKQKVLGCLSTLGRNLKLTDTNNIISGFSPEGFEVPILLTVGYLQSEVEKERIKERCWDIDLRLEELKMRRRERMIFSLGMGLLGMLCDRKRYEEISRQIFELEQERGEMIRKNLWNRNLDEILDYLKHLGKDAVFYLNEKGEERPLEEFFGFSK